MITIKLHYWLVRAISLDLQQRKIKKTHLCLMKKQLSWSVLVNKLFIFSFLYHFYILFLHNKKNYLCLYFWGDRDLYLVLFFLFESSSYLLPSSLCLLLLGLLDLCRFSLYAVRWVSLWSRLLSSNTNEYFPLSLSVFFMEILPVPLSLDLPPLLDVDEGGALPNFPFQFVSNLLFNYMFIYNKYSLTHYSNRFAIFSFY